MGHLVANLGLEAFSVAMDNGLSDRFMAGLLAHRHRRQAYRFDLLRFLVSGGNVWNPVMMPTS